MTNDELRVLVIQRTYDLIANANKEKPIGNKTRWNEIGVKISWGD